MINYNIQREHIEGLILSCFLNQHRTLEMDKMEFEAYKLPFELFKANNTHKMISKAIYNLQCEKLPVDDVNVHAYIIMILLHIMAVIFFLPALFITVPFHFLLMKK